MTLDETARAIDEAFRALLRHNFKAAQHALSRAQAEHYGQKPWFPGAPERDAIGNQIVYKDADGQGRYCVHEAQLDGAHVRVHLGGAGYTGPIRRFEARGSDVFRAMAVAMLYEKGAGCEDVRQTSAQALAVGSVCLQFQHGRAPLD